MSLSIKKILGKNLKVGDILASWSSRTAKITAFEPMFPPDLAKHGSDSRVAILTPHGTYNFHTPELPIFADRFYDVLDEPNKQDSALTAEEISLCRQWFDSLLDVHIKYLVSDDFALAAKLYQIEGIPVPTLIKSALPTTQSCNNDTENN